LKLYLEIITGDVKEKMNGEIRKKLVEAVALATRAIQAVRRLAFDLGPGIFEEYGFVPAIRFYVRRFSATTGVKARVYCALRDVKLPARHEVALYRVVQGALSNVVKHSGAKTVSIGVRGNATSVCMAIEDDGKGFNVERKSRDRRTTFGLQAMHERVELLGGAFRIQSPSARAGKRRYGTRIEVVLPVGNPEAT
jgi:signal transduction histidine kinase